jgi:hypothetical protein
MNQKAAPMIALCVTIESNPEFDRIDFKKCSAFVTCSFNRLVLVHGRRMEEQNKCR